MIRRSRPAAPSALASAPSRRAAAALSGASVWLLASLLAVAATSVLVAPASAGTTIEFGLGNRVEGSGHVVEQARTLAPFSRIRLDGSMTVNARPGSAPGATVKADDNIVPMILTSVEGDTLVIKTQPNVSFRTRSTMVVNVSFTQLKNVDLRGSGDLNVSSPGGPSLELSLAGSGDVRLDGAELGQLKARLAGSGDIWLKGRADEASFSIAGSGDVHAADLSARRVGVDIAGSGDARVQASEVLDVRIAGSGDVTYGGSPAKVNSRVVGSGDLRVAR